MFRSSFRIFGLVLAGQLPLPLLAQSTGAAVQIPTTPPVETLNSAGSVAQVMLGLAVVLALMFAVAWIMKRMGIARTASTQAVRVVGGTSVGNRERVVVVEIGDQWIVVGVAPGRVNSLATMPRQADISTTMAGVPQTRSFASWLNSKKDLLQKSQPGTSGTSHE